jgi:hypothetical protein
MACPVQRGLDHLDEPDTVSSPFVARAANVIDAPADEIETKT